VSVTSATAAAVPKANLRMKDADIWYLTFAEENSQRMPHRKTRTCPGNRSIGSSQPNYTGASIRLRTRPGKALDMDTAFRVDPTIVSGASN
jgi:hypothetical protein